MSLDSLLLPLSSVTEQAAMAAFPMIGMGDEKEADRVAVEAMRGALDNLSIDGTIMIGEGERDKAPMLYAGEKVGSLECKKVDIAVDPLEGTTLTAKAMPGAITVIAMSLPGGLLHAPDVYMEKIVIGRGYSEDLVSIDRDMSDNLIRLAKSKGSDVSDLRVCVLDRERHYKIISEIRSAGASVCLIPDGDIVAALRCVQSLNGGIDMYVGSGGAPEGVLAAAALSCVGGHIQGRLQIRSKYEERRAAECGISDTSRIYTTSDMVKSEVIFSATGVTDGFFLRGIRKDNSMISTETLLLSSSPRIIRKVCRSELL
mgnify:CR=1 FL=1